MLTRLSSKEVPGIAAPMLALGMAGLAIINYRPWLEQRTGYKFVVLDYYCVPLIFLSFAAAGAALLFVWLVASMVQRALFEPIRDISNRLKNIQEKLNDLSCDACGSADINVIANFAATEFGPMAADIRRSQRLYEIDNMAYKKVVDKKGRIVGFYDLFRLSASGTKAIKNGNFDIRSCPDEFIRSDQKYRYVNVYVGGVYAKNNRARAKILGAISGRLLEIRPTNVFARAGSNDGLRLLKDANFVPVISSANGIGDLFMMPIVVTTGSDNHSRGRRGRRTGLRGLR